MRIGPDQHGSFGKGLEARRALRESLSMDSTLRPDNRTCRHRPVRPHSSSLAVGEPDGSLFWGLVTMTRRAVTQRRPTGQIQSTWMRFLSPTERNQVSIQYRTASPLATRRRAALLSGVVAAVALAIPVLGTPDQVLANTPACNNLSHNTGSGAGQFPCTAGGGQYSMLCIGVLRSGPGVAYANHGTATGTSINLYQIRDNGGAVQGGCGGPTTNRWFLSSNGWASRSITTANF